MFAIYKWLDIVPQKGFRIVIYLNTDVHKLVRDENNWAKMVLKRIYMGGGVSWTWINLKWPTPSEANIVAPKIKLKKPKFCVDLVPIKLGPIWINANSLLNFDRFFKIKNDFD